MNIFRSLDAILSATQDASNNLTKYKLDFRELPSTLRRTIYQMLRDYKEGKKGLTSKTNKAKAVYEEIVEAIITKYNITDTFQCAMCSINYPIFEKGDNALVYDSNLQRTVFKPVCKKCLRNGHLIKCDVCGSIFKKDHAYSLAIFVQYVGAVLGDKKYNPSTEEIVQDYKELIGRDIDPHKIYHYVKLSQKQFLRPNISYILGDFFTDKFFGFLSDNYDKTVCPKCFSKYYNLNTVQHTYSSRIATYEFSIPNYFQYHSKTCTFPLEHNYSIIEKILNILTNVYYGPEYIANGIVNYSLAAFMSTILENDKIISALIQNTNRDIKKNDILWEATKGINSTKYDCILILNREAKKYTKDMVDYLQNTLVDNLADPRINIDSAILKDKQVWLEEFDANTGVAVFSYIYPEIKDLNIENTSEEDTDTIVTFTYSIKKGEKYQVKLDLVKDLNNVKIRKRVADELS